MAEPEHVVMLRVASRQVAWIAFERHARIANAVIHIEHPLVPLTARMRLNMPLEQGLGGDVGELGGVGYLR